MKHLNLLNPEVEPGFFNSLLYGYSVFTTFKTPIDNVSFKAHWERLVQNAQAFHLAFEEDFQEVYQAVRALLPQQVVRLTVIPQASDWGEIVKASAKNLLSSQLIVFIKPLNPLGSSQLALKTVSYQRSFPLVKHGSLADALLQKRDAMEAGYDDVLWFNSASHITEASTSNFFGLHQGVLYTPDPQRDGCLPGITREQVLIKAQQQRIPVSSEPLLLNTKWDGAFLTNAVSGLRAVKQIDEYCLNWSNEAQAIFEQLQV